MSHWLFWPPIVLLLMLGVAWALWRLLAPCTVKTTAPAPGKLKAYACGEDMPENRAHPGYDQFFPFAFFFTIMHVLALVVATVPASNWAAVQIAAGYLVSSSIGLFILFRK